MTALRDLTAGQQVVLDVDTELVIEIEADDDTYILTFHDGRRTIPLPGSVEVVTVGDQLSIV